MNRAKLARFARHAGRMGVWWGLVLWVVTGAAPGPIRAPVSMAQVNSTAQAKVAPFRRVPNVVGLRARAAYDTLKTWGLTWKADASPDLLRRGCVTSQTPSPGAQVTPGSVVVLQLADCQTSATPSPTPFLVVPSVIGLNEDEAKQVLEKAGFSLQTVYQQRSQETPGRVIRQMPAAGTQFVRPAPVDIVLAVDDRVEVPSLIGLRLGAARSLLDKVGLRVGQTSPSALDISRAVVKRQSPLAGGRVQPGTRVNLVFTPRSVTAKVWTSDSTVVAGDSLVVGIDVSPSGAGRAYRFDFGDRSFSPWISLPRAKHAYRQPGSYLVRASVQLEDKEIVLADSSSVLVTRNLTPILTFTVILGAVGWPFLWKLLQKAPVAAWHVQLTPRVGWPATVATTVGDHPEWSLAIQSPGEIERCELRPSGLVASARRNP